MGEKTPGSAANSAPTIDLLEIWGIFWSRKLLIFICIIVAAALAFVKVAFLTEDVYSANGTLYVSNRSQVTAEEDDMVYGSDINTSRLMSTTYMEILTMRSFLSDVSEDIGGKYSWQQIRRMMSISTRNDTELLTISVNCNSPEDAYEIANCILDQAPYKLGTVFDGGEVKVVEHAVVPAWPNGKNMPRTLMLAMLAGLAIGCAIAFLLDYFDNKVHRSDDVAKRYNIPILGEISQ